MRYIVHATAVVVTLLFSGHAVVVAGQTPDRATRDAIADAERLMRRGDNFEAVKRLQQLNAARSGCAECLVVMSEAMLNMKVYPNALDTAAQAIGLAVGQPPLLSRAHGIRAQVFQAQAETDSAKYIDAEREFRLAADLDPESEYMHFGLGVTLLKLNRDVEGVAALKRFLEIRDIGQVADAARAMIANPRRGRERIVPDYSITAIDGTPLSPEALKGKVVLYDFWATWCPPCVAAVPSLRNLQKKYANAPFVIVGISADQDDYVWRRFTTKERMVWPQFWDRRREMASKFTVAGYPTYVLVDGDGIEQLRIAGDGFHRARGLQKAIDAQIAKLAGASARVP